MLLTVGLSAFKVLRYVLRGAPARALPNPSRQGLRNRASRSYLRERSENFSRIIVNVWRVSSSRATGSCSRTATNLMRCRGVGRFTSPRGAGRGVRGSLRRSCRSSTRSARSTRGSKARGGAETGAACRLRIRRNRVHTVFIHDLTQRVVAGFTARILTSQQGTQLRNLLAKIVHVSLGCGVLLLLPATKLFDNPAGERTGSNRDQAPAVQHDDHAMTLPIPVTG